VHRLLKPGGRACIQSIVIDDALFDRYVTSTDFIQQYIFPGGCLPCPREFRREAEAAGLEVVDEFAFGQDYAETLRRWRDKFLASRQQVLQLGFDERFMRVWEFYLAYCEAAFAKANIDLVQYTLLVAAAVLLALTYAGYSMLSIAHQSWGAMLGGDASQRSRIVGWREGMGLVGVVLASVVPTLAGLPAMVALFGVLLVVGWVFWTQAPRPVRAATPHTAVDLRLPLRRAPFRRLLAVFVLNGIASAVPATLVLFFVQDRLRAPAAMEPAFLGLYFVVAAASIPVWLRIVRRWGLARSWLGGMCMSVAVFAWAGAMGAGDAVPFLVVCALSGFAIGSDLVLPSALLAGIIAEAGDQPHAGAYFGWWNFATKLNLALAAGLALPLLGLAGYVPGARDASALQALSLAYCLLPCVLKVIAGVALWALVIRSPASVPPVPLPAKAAP
jgi:GPH family glycoside/pentoside/hexuronide:cation symporter